MRLNPTINVFVRFSFLSLLLLVASLPQTLLVEAVPEQAKLLGREIYFHRDESGTDNYKTLSALKPTSKKPYEFFIDGNETKDYYVDGWVTPSFVFPAGELGLEANYNFLFSVWAQGLGNASFYFEFYLLRESEELFLFKTLNSWYLNETTCELLWQSKMKQSLTLQSGDRILLKLFLNVEVVGDFTFFCDSQDYPSYMQDPVETRYFREEGGLSNGVWHKWLITSQGTYSASVTAGDIDGETGLWCKLGIRVYERYQNASDESAQYREITSPYPSEPVAQVQRTSEGEGYQDATWDCPEWYMSDAYNCSISNIEVRLYYQFEGDGWVKEEEWHTAQLGASKLNASTWTVTYYWKLVWLPFPPTSRFDFYYNVATRNSRIENFTWTEYTEEEEEFDCDYIGLNNTLTGEPTKFSSDWTDLNQSEGLSHNRFSTNNTGTWINDTWTNSWENTVWAVATKTLNSTVDLIISFRFFVNDSSSVAYASTICFFTTRTDKVNPVARFNTTITTAHVNETISFDGSMSIDPDGGSLTNYEWNFGDSNTTSGNYPTITHKWSSSSSNTINLTVTDDESATNSFFHTINISNYQDPVARFTFTPSNPQEKETVMFDASETWCDPDTSISTYIWNFGDGTSSSTQSTTHNYQTPGTYTATLNVTDSQSNTDTFSQTIAVSALPHTGGSGAGSTVYKPPTIIPPTTPTSPVTFTITDYPRLIRYIPAESNILDFSNTFDFTITLTNHASTTQNTTLALSLSNRTGYIYWQSNKTFTLQPLEQKDLALNVPIPNEDAALYLWIQTVQPTVSEPAYVGFTVQSLQSWMTLPFVIGIVVAVGSISGGYGVHKKRKGNKKNKPRHTWGERNDSNLWE